MIYCSLLSSKLGPWSVVCSLPNSGRFTYGVIAPIDVESNLAAMSARVRVDGSAAFVKMERLTRVLDGQKVPSTSIRMVFEGKVLPKSVKIGFVSYPVRKYDFPPLQCYRCQRFGHSADGCNSKIRCMVCAGPHRVADCQNGEIKCANCGGPHKANSRDCGRAPRREERKHPEHLRVSTVRARGGSSQMSHSSQSSSRVVAPWSPHCESGSGQGAHSQEMLANANCCVCRPVVGSPGLSSYRSAVVGRNSVDPFDFPGFSPVASSGPARSASSAAALPSDGSVFADSVFLSRLTACLADLFSLSLHRESVAKTQSLISTAVKKHFNVTLPNSSCASIVAGSLPREQESCRSPSADAICSASEDLATCLGVDDFELVTESDASVDIASSVGDPDRSFGVPSSGNSLRFLDPTPSPVIGSTRGRPVGCPKKDSNVKAPNGKAPNVKAPNVKAPTKQKK